MKRFLQFILEKNDYDVDETWHNLDHKNPAHAKVVKAFGNLGDLQRGEPEEKMLDIQRYHSGGVVPNAVEHVGDIIHRMSTMARYGYYGTNDGEVPKKLRTQIGSLRSGYGFAKEHAENIKANKIDEKHLDNLLKNYADAHSKLPVYNRAQFHARAAAVALGNKDWDMSASHLERLQDMMNSKEGWNHHASKFRFARDGVPREYNIGDD